MWQYWEKDLFICLWIFVPIENFSLIWRRHHCRWRDSNFDLCLALMTIEQWGFFSLPHLLRHVASVYNGHLWEPITLTPIADRLATELSLPAFTTGLLQHSHTQSSAWEANALPPCLGNRCRHTVPVWYRYTWDWHLTYLDIFSFAGIVGEAERVQRLDDAWALSQTVGDPIQALTQELCAGYIKMYQSLCQVF